MYVPGSLLLLALCFWIWRLDTKPSLATQEPGLPPVSRAESRAMDRADRRARWQEIYARYQEPWPWWFLGAQLALALLCLVAGIASWPHVDAYALMLGGALFLCFFLFKAWAQTRAVQAPPHAPQAQQ